jgi:hypothetical protein
MFNSDFISPGRQVREGEAAGSVGFGEQRLIAVEAGNANRHARHAGTA